MRFRWVVLGVSVILTLVDLSEAGIWGDEDTVVIEEPTAAEIASSNTRLKRQFMFQFPSWGSQFPGFPRPPSGIRPGPGSCYAANGQEGQCATFRQCFPILYSLEEGQEDVIQNEGLAELLRDASGPCESPIMSNYFYFRADAEVRQNMICCSQNKRPIGYPPLRPQQPGGGIKLPKPPSAPGRPKLPNPTAPTQKPNPPTARPTTDSPKIDNPSTCGNPYVVGGSQSPKGKHPWIVALTNNGRQFCGGSLISSYFILTAAHCVSHMTSTDITRIRVHLGEHQLSVGENTEQFEKVSRVMYHRGFSHQTLHNDVALLKLQSPARETQYIRPVCLEQNTRETHENRDATLAGWGQTADGGSQAQTLREVTMSIWTNERCKAKYGRMAPAGILPSMVCAGSNGRDACRGDSGGPLVIKSSQNVFMQIGVVSWGIGCGTYPGVYSRVSHFMPWIDKNRKV